MSVLSNIKTYLANRSNYGSWRSTSNIKYIVIHYTGNDGDTDENNGKYFRNNVVKASAHYFVDDDSITQSVPENYVAYHCGASTYKHPYCRNSNSIGIEICDDVRNGVIYPSAKTIQNVLVLVEYLMEKYNIPKGNVIRHYDVTGKLCPAYWCGNASKDYLWKTEFWNKLGTTYNVSNNSTRPNVNTNTDTEELGVAVTPYLIKINTNKGYNLNVRAKPGTNYPIVTQLKKNIKYTIVREYNGWGKLKSGVGWVSLNYTKRV